MSETNTGERWILYVDDEGVTPFIVTDAVTDAQWKWLRATPRDCKDAEWLQIGLTAYNFSGVVQTAGEWSADAHRSGDGEWVIVYDG